MSSHEDEPPPNVSLPEEIWQNVASRLSLRDWARASGLRSPAGRVVATTLMAAQNTSSNVSQLVLALDWVQLLQEDEGHADGTQLLSYLAAAAERLRTVLPALRTFRWSAFYMKFGLPPVLQPSNTLSRVVLDVYRFAPQQAALRSAFSPFTSVLIACETGIIDLSGGRWRHLSAVHVEGKPSALFAF
ncbi:hypothetical protein COCSUDRAFT_56211 [Coccomyxa subellipsoidea C-169]|uniref:Uncharacterized protein n=1 Tax=Coccomyxa subellipsoidea (strain C-169) TaxID=574566 RepID=I0YTP6_COCSC|nr:hypothetical protein COCSUDRAFT_56211 [Coccomyxa subellipsoidea C-169]EIE21765.1 hypothetical protein COCSUDRAFT_56211 [Coccomyxa subellipsoidea C-169]|eukprot:XP_005646309.1 hypothetical protein COCSUDRAFT_56211 [Coccomyxa subellipsoidea C-169]